MRLRLVADIGDQTQYLSAGIGRHPIILAGKINGLQRLTYLLGVRLILHSRQTRSTAWLANRRGTLPPWRAGLSTPPEPSVAAAAPAADSLTHFWAVW